MLQVRDVYINIHVKGLQRRIFNVIGKDKRLSAPEAGGGEARAFACGIARSLNASCRFPNGCSQPQLLSRYYSRRLPLEIFDQKFAHRRQQPAVETTRLLLVNAFGQFRHPIHQVPL